MPIPLLDRSIPILTEANKQLAASWNGLPAGAASINSTAITPTNIAIAAVEDNQHGKVGKIIQSLRSDAGVISQHQDPQIGERTVCLRGATPGPDEHVGDGWVG
jgi:hypothetical protein